MEEKATAENNEFEKLFSADLAVTVRDVSIEMLPLEKPHGGEPRQRRRIYRVPAHLRRRNENRTEYYDPTVVSIGPYHHDRPELRAAEEVKRRLLNRLTSGGGAPLHETILERIGEFRNYYADDCVEKFDDGELATMLLLDASFMLALMEALAGDGEVFRIWHQCVGIATLQFAFPDLMLLENQLPFPVLKLIVTLRRGEEEGIGLLSSFIKWFLSGDFNPHLSAESGADDPLHLLEACHIIFVAENSNSPSKTNRTPTHLSGLKFSHQDRDITTRTATDLKSKGIEVRPNNSSRSIRDIKFRSTSFAAAELLLPPQIVGTNTLSILSNLIAYEMSPGAASIGIRGAVVRKPDEIADGERGRREGDAGAGDPDQPVPESEADGGGDPRRRHLRDG